MQSYTQIQDSARVSDSLAPLLNNDLTAMSRSSGTAYPTTGLVVGMPFYSTSQNKLYRLTSVSPVTWVVEIDYNRSFAYADDIATVTANANGRVSRAGDTMTGFLTLNADPTQSLHATSKRYVDNAVAAATNIANQKMSAAGGSMSGYLTLVGDPQSAYHAATKNYADYLYNSLNNAKLNRNGDTVSEVYNNGWYRSNGQVGWYNQTYGGGIHMQDGSYVRVYGGKGFQTDTHTFEQGTGGIWTSRYGWLENRFADKSAEGAITSVGTLDSGSGGVINPAAFYLQQSGRQVQLVRVQGNCNCNCACTCFPAGTRILLADRSWKNVEDIVVGDVVMTPTGAESVLEVETPLLGDRAMVSFRDGSLYWTDDHAFWTRREGTQGFAVYDRKSFMNGVQSGVVTGLKDHELLLTLDDKQDEFAHTSGWKKQEISVSRSWDPNTRVYLPVVGGCHMIIAEGYVVSAGMNGFDFDYDAFRWEGLDHARA